ncbi:hypothetical protein IU470_07460 [Nocardia abscessus]|uniref:Lipoprotein n=1 Tax=Nocardia abscessus TaxID=120957 RepID=A0ABS0C5A8_9NOCA|nr:hypothetical protein [Nocardia abscessus]MBF6224945.1 hypothetical protein [Nocardia abscessus]
MAETVSVFALHGERWADCFNDLPCPLRDRMRRATKATVSDELLPVIRERYAKTSLCLRSGAGSLKASLRANLLGGMMFSLRDQFYVRVVRFCAVVPLVFAGCVLGVGYGVANAAAGSCEVQVHNVHQSKGSPGLMDVKGTLTCQGAVERADVFIYYVDVAGSEWVRVESSIAQRTVFSPSPGKKYTVMSQNGTPCVAGVYIGVAEGYITVDGKTTKNYQNGFGPRSTVSC